MARSTARIAGQYSELILGWRRNPVAFSRTVLRSDPWAGAQRIMRAIAEPHARVAVRGAHATAKTRTAAEVLLWWVATGGTVVTTASRFAQVRQGVWSRVQELLQASRLPLGAEVRQAEIDLGGGAKALGWSTDNETRFQGMHAERLLFIVDEAPGVAPGIYRAISGSRAGGDVRELHNGNPSSPAGPFFDAHRSSSWTSIRLDAFDSPNMDGICYPEGGVPESAERPTHLMALVGDALDLAPRPYLATRRWVREQATDYGPTSPYWQWKVRGEFPQQAEDALVLLSWLEGGRAPMIPIGGDGGIDPTEPVEAGIDVAGPGEDEHVICVRRGPNVISIEAVSSTDPERLVGMTISRLKKLDPPPAIIKVDSVGIGTYFVTHLKQAGLPAVGVNVAQAATTEAGKRRFVNQKAEHYWTLRERFKDGLIRGLNDERAISQLATMRWREPAGRVEIEGKDEMRRRGLRSPDRAEALMLAFAKAKPSGIRVYVS